jgi:hypothetical protein
MAFGLSDRGEELHYRNGFVGQDIDITIYLDNTDIDGDGTKEGDDLDDTDDVTAVTTEPSVTRRTVTVQSADIEKINGDFGFSKEVELNVSGLTGKIDATLLIESGTDNIIARTEQQDPEPAPYQSLDGLKKIKLEPQITTD